MDDFSLHGKFQNYHVPLLPQKVSMVHKKRLTRAKPSSMVGDMKAGVASQGRNSSVVTIAGIEFRILPEKEYEGMVATMEIMKDHRLYNKIIKGIEESEEGCESLENVLKEIKDEKGVAFNG
jgi:hypothetical protein